MDQRNTFPLSRSLLFINLYGNFSYVVAFNPPLKTASLDIHTSTYVVSKNQLHADRNNANI